MISGFSRSLNPWLLNLPSGQTNRPSETMHSFLQTIARELLSRASLPGRHLIKLMMVLQTSLIGVSGYGQESPPQQPPLFTGYTLGGGAFGASIDDGWAAGFTGSAGLVIKESSLFYINGAGSHGEIRNAGDSDLRLFNIGGGYRFGFPDGMTSLGVNTYYDELKIKSTNEKSSQQSFGIDATHDRWFLNANWYEPLTGDTYQVKRSATRMVETRQSQFHGWDAEIGAVLYREPARPINIIAAIGYYDFGNAFSSASGIRARTDVTFWDRFSIGAEWRQNGAAFGQEWRFIASMRYAIGRSFGQRAFVPSSDLATATPLPIEPVYSSGKAVLEGVSGKSVVGNVQSYSTGKDAKNVLPVLPLEAFEPPEDLNVKTMDSAYSPLNHGMNHLNPRAFWPTRRTQVQIQTFPQRSFTPTRTVRFPTRPVAPPCNRCVSGNPIRFD